MNTCTAAIILWNTRYLEAALDALRAHGQRALDDLVPLEGMLRLSCSDWFGTYILAPILAKFSERHPKVCVELLYFGSQADLAVWSKIQMALGESPPTRPDSMRPTENC